MQHTQLPTAERAAFALDPTVLRRIASNGDLAHSFWKLDAQSSRFSL